MARTDEYDWIDDAFDDSKEDSLANKGMTGCSNLAVLFAALAVLAIVGLLAGATFLASALPEAFRV